MTSTPDSDASNTPAPVGDPTGNAGRADSAVVQQARESIADALWLRGAERETLPADVAAKVADPRNSDATRGEQMRRYLAYLLNHPLSHTPDLTKRYEHLLDVTDTLTPQQAYVMQTSFLGPPSTVGYDMIPREANLQFPRDHEPKLRSQVGWHFFVGSCWDADGNEYGAELMFFGTALYPPNFAARLGLDDVDNQIVELQLAISKRGGRHYQAEPVTLAGTSGLIDVEHDPLVFRLGRNEMRCHNSDGLFPVTIRGWGVDRGGPEPVELGLDLTFTRGKETLLQGAAGCMPSIDGIGSLYYSIPDLELDPSCSTLNLDGTTITLTRGQFWFDHQWGYLTGAACSPVLRAANWSSDPAPGGWDWFMTQLTDDRQITMFSPHSAAYRAFYEQTGPTPPATMTVPVKGTMMAANRSTSMVHGTLAVTDWIKADHSPNPQRYLVTDTWYPNRWHFTFDESVPADIRSFELVPIGDAAQSGFFANGAQYAEGAVVVVAPDGSELGRGFAESVSYADSRDTVLRLAGRPETEAEMDTLITRTTPKALALFNAGYVLTHQSDLAAIMADAKGMEYFLPDS